MRKIIFYSVFITYLCCLTYGNAQAQAPPVTGADFTTTLKQEIPKDIMADFGANPCACVRGTRMH